MKYICLGYADPNLFASVSEAEMNAMMDSCFAYDDQLRAKGHFTGGEALQPPNTAMTLRYANGRVVVTDGPYVETKEHLGGFVLVEVKDRAEALELAKSSAMTRYGSIEVRQHWSLEEYLER